MRKHNKGAKQQNKKHIKHTKNITVRTHMQTEKISSSLRKRPWRRYVLCGYWRGEMECKKSAISYLFNDVNDVRFNCPACCPTYTKITRSAMKISMAATLLNIVLTAIKKRRPCLQCP